LKNPLFRYASVSDLQYKENNTAHQHLPGGGNAIRGLRFPNPFLRPFCTAAGDGKF
jgi:hypothetical protein